jgi:hypothetical protein
MEKLVDRHIRDGVSTIHPLHRNQHAYQERKSTETALHNVVSCIENATEHKEIALGAFFDMVGDFDRTSFDTIKQGIEPAICRWICAMLESKNIIATLSGETLGVSVARGVSSGRYAFDSAVGPGCGRSLGAQRQWVLHGRIC